MVIGISPKVDLVPIRPSFGELTPYVGISDEIHKIIAITPTSAAMDVPDYSAYARQDDESWLGYNLRRIDDIPLGPYGTDVFVDHVTDVGYEVAAAFAGLTWLGTTKWKWGSRSFYTKSEGWFEKDTYSIGMDKLGHAYTSYLFTEYFTQRIAHENVDATGAAITGAILGMGLQTYIEIFDGLSEDHGFSYEDMVMNAAGATFSVLRSTNPELASKVDFRRLYWPSGDGERKFMPVSDYAGQKYVLALKLAGFDALEDTPLRFVELHGGYYARGFTPEEKKRGEPRRRELYVGIGVNLTELLHEAPTRNTVPSLLLENISRYHQLPYTYVGTDEKP